MFDVEWQFYFAIHWCLPSAGAPSRPPRWWMGKLDSKSCSSYSLSTPLAGRFFYWLSLECVMSCRPVLLYGLQLAGLRHILHMLMLHVRKSWSFSKEQVMGSDNFNDPGFVCKAEQTNQSIQWNFCAQRCIEEQLINQCCYTQPRLSWRLLFFFFLFWEFGYRLCITIQNWMISSLVKLNSLFIPPVPLSSQHFSRLFSSKGTPQNKHEGFSIKLLTKAVWRETSNAVVENTLGRKFRVSKNASTRFPFSKRYHFQDGIADGSEETWLMIACSSDCPSLAMRGLLLGASEFWSEIYGA